MKSKLIVVGIMITVMAACGTERPNPEDYRPQRGNTGSVTTTNTKKTDTKTADAGKKDSTNTMAPATPPADATPPATATPPAAAPAKAPIRTLVNQTEIANAQTAYGTDCARCHGALATSAKKGRTRTQIEASVTVAAHVNTAGLVAKWPKDVADTTDDGVDTAMLKGSAMEQALK